jgi:hypothetical protein
VSQPTISNSLTFSGVHGQNRMLKLIDEAFGVMIVTFQEIVDSIDGLSTEEQTRLFEFVCQRQQQIELGDETDYLLSSPRNAQHLQRSIEQLRQGRVLEHELINE